MCMVSAMVVSRFRSLINPVFKLFVSKMMPYGTPIASISVNLLSGSVKCEQWRSREVNTEIFDRCNNIEIYFLRSSSSRFTVASAKNQRQDIYTINELQKSYKIRGILLPQSATLYIVHWYGATFRWRHISPKSPASMLSRTVSEKQWFFFHSM